MSLIQWDNSYSVGVAEIDLQHQKLIEMINYLHKAMSEGKANDVLGHIVNELMSLVLNKLTRKIIPDY